MLIIDRPVLYILNSNRSYKLEMYDTPDQWVDWGDITVQVDPVGTSQWVNDTNERHQETLDRGRAYKAKSVKELQNWEQNVAPITVKYYEPKSDIFDTFNTWQTCPEWHDLPNVSANNKGDRPFFRQLLHDNKLINKSIGDIMSEIQESEKRIAHRLFDKS